jgi:aspartate/methionine/tyrosine aminotransferase
MGVAENKLMHQELVQHITENFRLTPKMLTYGEGMTGSSALKQALAGFINREFKPKELVLPSAVSAVAGVSSVIDGLAFCLCEEEEGVLVGRPLFVGFKGDLQLRAKFVDDQNRMKYHFRETMLTSRPE